MLLKQIIIISLIAPALVWAEGRSDAFSDQLSAEVSDLHNKNQKYYPKNTRTTANTEEVVVADPYVQEVPSTYVEASPLVQSRSNRLRKRREMIERKTEERIVEVLEEDRMREEQERADRLFGNQLNQMNSYQNNRGVLVAPVQMAAPVDNSVKEDVEDIKSNVNSIVQKIEAKEKKAKLKAMQPKDLWYISLLMGAGSYPDVSNIKGVYNFGFALGVDYGNYRVEGTYNKSSYDLDNHCQNYYGSTTCVGNNFDLQEVDQHNFGISAITSLGMKTKIRPVLGATAAYSKREYREAYGNQSTNWTSNAFDVGLIGGADIKFSTNLSLGADVRYMWNLSSRRDRENDGPYQNTNWSLQNNNPIEENSYYIFNVALRFLF